MRSQGLAVLAALVAFGFAIWTVNAANDNPWMVEIAQAENAGGLNQVFQSGFEQDCPAGCPDGMTCRFDQCVPGPRSCTETVQCGGDSYCDTSMGECLPWGVGPGGSFDQQCAVDLFPQSYFPDIQCKWNPGAPGDPFPSHVNVIGTPVLADFSRAGADSPWLVFTSYQCTDGGLAACTGSDPGCTAVIRVVDGATCGLVSSISAPVPIASSTPALADLNRDGVPEIVAAKAGGGLAAWQYSQDSGFEIAFDTESDYGAGICNWGGPSVHDLNDDGSPEIVLFAGVFDATGTPLDVTLDPGLLSTGYIPIVADVDVDQRLELLTAKVSYQWDTDDEWVIDTQSNSPSGNVAVGDFGTFPANGANDNRAVLDGIAEIVVVGESEVLVMNHLRRVLMGVSRPGAGIGGLPVVADFDGDGRAEVAVANGTSFSVFDLDCRGVADPVFCRSQDSGYFLWSRPVQDFSSGRTGAVGFDFDGNGAVEAVYADECFTRMFDGTTGDVLFSRARNSCTFYDHPVIADTDSDFLAEIVVPSNGNCSVTCPELDPLYEGPRCDTDADCRNTTVCRRESENDAYGLCRCTKDSQCGDGSICTESIPGPSAQGKVCLAGHSGAGKIAPIEVIEDPLGRWAGSRAVWNQDAYSITNISRYGWIPRSSSWSLNWQQQGLNDFRVNRSRGGGSQPDLTVRDGDYECLGDGIARIDLQVCNRGLRPVPGGVEVRVMDGDQTACTTVTGRELRPGSCIVESCIWPGVSSTVSHDLLILADEDGSLDGKFMECRERNNEFVIQGAICP